MQHYITMGCALLLALVMGVPVARAAEETATSAAEPEHLRVQANELRSRAKWMRTQADKTQADAEMLCRDKLLMASCLDDARKARQEAERAILRVEREAAELERRHRYQARAAKLAQRVEKDHEQAVKAAERAQEIRREDEQRRLKNQKRLADEERRRQKAGRE